MHSKQTVSTLDQSPITVRGPECRIQQAKAAMALRDRVTAEDLPPETQRAGIVHTRETDVDDLLALSRPVNRDLPLDIEIDVEVDMAPLRVSSHGFYSVIESRHIH